MERKVAKPLWWRRKSAIQQQASHKAQPTRWSDRATRAAIPATRKWRTLTSVLTWQSNPLRSRRTLKNSFPRFRRTYGHPGLNPAVERKSLFFWECIKALRWLRGRWGGAKQPSLPGYATGLFYSVNHELPVVKQKTVVNRRMKKNNSSGEKAS